jgi:hypothetical protein
MKRFCGRSKVGNGSADGQEIQPRTVKYGTGFGFSGKGLLLNFQIQMPKIFAIVYSPCTQKS